MKILYLKNFFILILFLVFQLKGMSILGTYWDDAGYIQTIPIIYDKIRIFFSQPDNPFLGHFNYNLEFYGYLFPIIIDILSKIQIPQLFVKFVLENLYSYKVINNFDLLTITRFLILNFIIVNIIFYLTKFNKKIYGKRYSILFVLFLILIPSFNGHLFFNIKDIPFSVVFYFISIYFFNINNDNLFKTSQNNFKFIIKISIVFSTLLLIRISGIIFLGFLCTCYYFFNLKRSQIFKRTLNYFTNLVFIFTLTSFITFIFTPSSWRYPKIWLTRALETQFILSDWSGEILTNGQYLNAQNLPKNYLLEWFFYKLPINIIFFIVLAIIYIFINKKKFDNFTNYSVIFLISIFSFFSVFQPLSYDGIRQYLFLIPFIAHIITIFLVNILKIQRLKILTNLAIISSIIYMISSQYSLYPYTYIYYNEFVDEEKITFLCEDLYGCGEWETDYWGLSGKSLVKDIIEIIEPEQDLLFCKPEKVFSNYIEGLNKYASSETFYIASINRPGKLNSICDHIDKTNKTCEIKYIKSVDLRGTEIYLSYLYFCF